MTELSFAPSREAALAALHAFTPKAARDYAALRNHDLPGHPHVSRLSPYIRHRVLTEEEVLASVLGKWTLSASEKFVQEVIWRSYFKGWLELRPEVWQAYRTGRDAAWNRVQTESGLRRAWQAACCGETGIDAFDHWAHELVETGYLHNHARMWFASVWIFTLDLPWELGADFFLRHLLDGDPASNTLGWRWVAGLHTRGKNYVATSGNIQRFTGGRFAPTKLSVTPAALDGPPHPEPTPLRETTSLHSNLTTGLLVTEDDLSLDLSFEPVENRSILVVNGASQRSHLSVSNHVLAMTDGLISDAITRCASHALNAKCVAAGEHLSERLTSWVAEEGIKQIAMPYLPQGPARDTLKPVLDTLAQSDIRIVEIRRTYDSRIWPLCTAGFFKVKKAIPAILHDLGLDQKG